MRPASADYDVVVLGGGPAGATAAALTAVQGRRVLLLDREDFPRFRLGESLMPATYATLERLGVLERMRQSAFPRKHSVQFFSKDGHSSVPFYFDGVCEGESAVTWQVERMQFDSMLLDNARDKGAEVVLRANAKEVLFDGSRARGVRVEFGDGEVREIAARVVVDATGQTALISRRLGLKNADPKLRHMAYYTRYRGGRRGEGRDEGATLIMHTRRDGIWFWYIPLPDDQVSVGLVGPVEALQPGAGNGLKEYFDDEVSRCEPLRERLERAEPTMPVALIRDFSYISHRIAGDGWVAAGDAFGFLDPIYSSGVFLAMKGAEMAADSIDDAFARGDFSAARLGAHGECFLEGMEALRKLVYAFYDPTFNFRAFLERFPDCKDDLVHLLVGHVYERPPRRLLEAMGQMFDLPETRRLARAEDLPAAPPVP